MDVAGFRSLRSLVSTASRSAFTQVRDEHPGELFYAFALLTDDTCQSLAPSCNSREGHERMIRYYAEKYPNSSTSPSWLKWFPFEWHFLNGGVDLFGAPLGLMTQLYDEIVRGDDREDTFFTFRIRSLAAIARGLADLDADGFFGRGNGRAGVLLCCSIWDSGDARWFQEETAQRLNPRESFEVFHREWVADWPEPMSSDSKRDVAFARAYREI